MAWSCGSTSNTKGIDVSSNNGSSIESESWWRTLRNDDGVQFGIIKATEGTTYTDPYVQSAWSACNAVNSTTGSALYHYLDWNVSGTDQANHFWNVVKALTNPTYSIDKSDLAVDIEGASSSSQFTVVEDFMTQMTSLLGGNMSDFLIYTNEITWKNLGNPTKYSYIALWLAAMNGQTWCPNYTFGGWGDWSFMQYGTATLDGVLCDLDELNA